jgi:Tol biopolymer transport system component
MLARQGRLEAATDQDTRRWRWALACCLAAITIVSAVDAGRAQQNSVWDFQDLCWAPNGRALLFTGIVANQYGIYYVDAQEKATPRRLLADVAGNQFSPTFAPDGRHFAFHVAKAGRNSILVAHDDGSDSTEIISPGSTPAWSPDGMSIAYTGKFSGVSQVTVMDPDGHHSRQLTTDAAPSFNPSWLPNGHAVLFESDRNHDGQDELYQIDADGTHEHLLLERAGANLVYPHASPDGRIFFAAVANRNVDQFVMEADGRNVTLFRAHTSQAQWSPTASKLAFIAYDDNRLREIFVATPDGSQVTQVTAVNHGGVRP